LNFEVAKNDLNSGLAEFDEDNLSIESKIPSKFKLNVGFGATIEDGQYWVEKSKRKGNKTLFKMWEEVIECSFQDDKSFFTS
jgi:hypothetical protein